MDIMRLLIGMDPDPLLCHCLPVVSHSFVVVPLSVVSARAKGFTALALEMTSPPACICLLQAVRLVPAEDTCSKLTDHSKTCEMFVEKTCALNAHETRTIVSCAKHHLTDPYSTCLENEKVIKQAVDEKKKGEQQTKNEKDGPSTK